MTAFDGPGIREILAQGEGRQVEFKEGLAPDGRAARTICAFANTRGGVLLVGVDDRGRPRGVARAEAAVRALQAIAAAIDPPVRVRAGRAEVGSATVVWCSVPLSPARPHAVGREPGGAPEILVRVGSSNRAAAPAVARALPPEPHGLPRALADAVLAAVARRGAASAADVASEHGLGRQRARQALERLECAGLLVAHGLGDERRFELP